MKILFLAPSIYMSPLFGDLIYAPRELAFALVDGLVARGHEVTFATAADVHTTAKVFPGDKAYLELIVKHLDPYAADAKEHTFIKRDHEVDLVARAFACTQKEHFDVIHVFAVPIAHHFEQFVHAPVVYTLHDPLPEKGTLEHIFFEKFASHHFVSISNSQRNSDLKLNFAGTVYHGLNLQVYPFHEKADNGFVFLGRLVPEKGVEDAMKACVIANEKLLIGSQFPKHGEESEYYKTAVAPMLDDPKIEEVGMVTDTKKADLLGKAKALLFPIKWEEPFGMVMIEAMACGTPVIAYNRGSVSEIVVDGKTGFIVEPEDRGNQGNRGNRVIQKTGTVGLVEAIGRIHEIDRAACRRHVEENFSVEKMVTAYEAVYKKLGK